MKKQTSKKPTRKTPQKTAHQQKENNSSFEVRDNILTDISNSISCPMVVCKTTKANVPILDDLERDLSNIRKRFVDGMTTVETLEYLGAVLRIAERSIENHLESSRSGQALMPFMNEV